MRPHTSPFFLLSFSSSSVSHSNSFSFASARHCTGTLLGQRSYLRTHLVHSFSIRHSNATLQTGTGRAMGTFSSSNTGLGAPSSTQSSDHTTRQEPSKEPQTVCDSPPTCATVSDATHDSRASRHPVYYNVSTRTHHPTTPIRKITPSYLTKAHEEPVTLTSPQRLLVILDLNGTLFYRNKSNKRSVTNRPHLAPFLAFLFSHCRVMVWSSAQPHSVDAMLKFGFGNRISKLDRVWTRQHFRLPEVDYARKVLTIKDLEYVWEGIAEEKKQHLATSEPNQGADKFQVEYDQTNTVLIDDSTAKIQLQPYNGLTLRDFDAELAKAGTDRELLKVMKYLEKLVYQQNVSAYMRLHPFDTNAPIDVVKQAKLAPEPSSDMDTLINRLQETSLTEQ